MSDAKVGVGGAPTRATVLPTDPAERKKYPIATGCFDYFPDALAVISNVSWAGNNQHNPGQSLRWDRSKSADESDTMLRHFAQRGTRDTDGMRHTAKAAWRMLAILQKELEGEAAVDEPTHEPNWNMQCDDVSRGTHSWSCKRTKGHTGRHVAFWTDGTRCGNDDTWD